MRPIPLKWRTAYERTALHNTPVHQREHAAVEFFLFPVVQPGVGGLTEVTEMRETEASALFDLFPKIGILLPEVEEGIHVPLVGLFELLADIAR